MDYLKRSEELFEETVENRRHLHQMPELGLELPETTAFIMEKLTEMGDDPKPCGGGVVAEKRAEKPCFYEAMWTLCR